MKPQAPTNPVWKDRLEKVLSKHFERAETVATVVALYGVMRTTRRMMTDNIDEETRIGVLQMAYDLTTALPNNPFMKLYGGQVMAVMSTALNSWIDSVGYLQVADDEQDQNKKMEYVKKGIATAHLIHELATVCLLYETGPGTYRDKSRELRDALHEIEDVLS